MDRTYLPVLLLFGVAILAAAGMLAVSALTVRARPTPEKPTPNESRVPRGPDLVLRTRRDARLHDHPARRLRLRLEEGRAAMELTRRPELPVRPAPDTIAVSRGGDPWITTKLDFLVNWGRANSLWPMPFGTACCAIEFMATAASKYDLARFGMERMSFAPRQAACSTITPWCRGSTPSSPSTSTCRAARPDRKG